jgi:hypothetical protein
MRADRGNHGREGDRRKPAKLEATLATQKTRSPSPRLDAVRKDLRSPRNAAKTTSLASKRHAEKDGPKLRYTQEKTPALWRAGADTGQKRQVYLLLQVPKPEITVSAEAKLTEAAGLA